ncbi:hypothetical protein GCM10017688_65230 [Streptomyces ramulosus]
MRRSLYAASAVFCATAVLVGASSATPAFAGTSGYIKTSYGQADFDANSGIVTAKDRKADGSCVTGTVIWNTNHGKEAAEAFVCGKGKTRKAGHVKRGKSVTLKICRVKGGKYHNCKTKKLHS